MQLGRLPFYQLNYSRVCYRIAHPAHRLNSLFGGLCAMIVPMIITSPHNPKVKALLALRERRTRETARLALVEGYEELQLALMSGTRPVELFYAPAYFSTEAQRALIERFQARGAACYEVSPRVFDKLAYREHPDGWIGTFAFQPSPLMRLRLSDAPFVVLCEGVEKPGNLGAILRTAEAAGVDAVIACDPRTDWTNPNVIRASKGALFALQVAAASNQEALAWLRQHEMRLIVATPSASVRYTAPDYRNGVALALGTEKHGLSSFWLANADQAVAIPMFGTVNSLNVSAAAALLIYEVVRQRT
ncbi:MAG: RNA methyltransferase [Candidatus Thermofonsia Clade 1 bacterium]|uniref:RNA methyltransferase n=1 Tax=Candidatus Thermofonsia Clade 1 bacterium TaxID=2364210 RepID=A0A2M8PFF2_9CHLR|nr:MAG: RNA methyltransferase [Candidatus Thermofonsia Clade 1 bacterium]RMF54043.1 MAG: RNA methyltransferase [Chloroflexota bacterium]